MTTAVVGTERILSVDDWAALPEDEPGELRDGCLVEEETPSFAHEVIVSFLIAVLRAYLSPRGGFVVGSEAKFAVAARRGRKPDLTVFLPGTPRPPAGASLSRTPPDVVVEVVSASAADARRDRIEKTDDYAAFGARWYWIVDPELRSLEILERDERGRYARAVAATGGVLETVPGLDGFRLDVGEMWAEVDRFGADDR